MVDVDKIIRYEGGEMDEQETIEFFQELVDTGMAWSLQGHYGRTATALIEAGHVTQPGQDADEDEEDEDEYDDDDAEYDRDYLLAQQELEDFEQADEYFGYYGDE